MPLASQKTFRLERGTKSILDRHLERKWLQEELASTLAFIMDPFNRGDPSPGSPIVGKSIVDGPLERQRLEELSMLKDREAKLLELLAETKLRMSQLDARKPRGKREGVEESGDREAGGETSEDELGGTEYSQL